METSDQCTNEVTLESFYKSVVKVAKLVLEFVEEGILDKEFEDCAKKYCNYILCGDGDLEGIDYTLINITIVRAVFSETLRELQNLLEGDVGSASLNEKNDRYVFALTEAERQKCAFKEVFLDTGKSKKYVSEDEEWVFEDEEHVFEDKQHKMLEEIWSKKWC